MILFIIAFIIIIGFVIFSADAPSSPNINSSKGFSYDYTKKDIEYLRKNLFK